MKPKAEKVEKEEKHTRRDRLLEIQSQAQNLWAQQKLYDSEPDPSRPKYLITFPYPYMNARLHLGHAFSCSKVEFFARYKRLKGFNVLFPFGFHCTGMPICAAAKKLEGELKTIGVDGLLKLSNSRAEEDPEYKKQKMTQFEILQSCYISTEEIQKFVDPVYWTQYFPPLAIDDLKLFGFSIDFRRSFITTDINPYYDSFIHWQFNKLKDKNVIKFGQRPSIFSEKDNQMCADHDRSVGEGVLPQEYTLIKIELTSFNSPKLESIHQSNPKKKIFLTAATLRPETMYGQTNCFVLPEGDYGVFQMKNDELWICSKRSARNMAFQNLTDQLGKVFEIATIKGEELIGQKVRAPLSYYKEVYVWPMLSIKMDKGTGVVTSVPSDAPDDYAVLVDFVKKKPLREKYKLSDEMVLPFKPVEIIEVPDYSKLSAVKAYTDANVGSMNDKAKLEAIKKEVYTAGFYKGIMLVGEYAGLPVQEAKKNVKNKLVQSGEAAIYYEPDGECVSRSGDDCVVAYINQWYINYGQKETEEKLVNWVKSENFSAFNDNIRNLIVEGVEWLKDWGCSRSFGLGSRLPWDNQFLIESLSDSTIYMAYYTVAHFLQKDLNGKEPGSLNIKASDIQIYDWDYIFLNKEYNKESKIPEDKLKKMRDSFNYYYPMDLRCSGKDLAKNHLTMALYNHEFVWGGSAKEMLPKGYYLNGWILVDGEKMSKQKGNFILVKGMVDKFSADASRILLATAGDSLADANAVLEEADKAVVKITTLESWLKDIKQTIGTMRNNSPEDVQFLDHLFENKAKALIQSADKLYQSMLMREVTIELFFNLVSIKEDYKINCGAHGMRADLVKSYIKNLLISLYPLIPHFCEIMWIENYLPLLTEQERKNVPDHISKSVYPTFDANSIDFSVLSKKEVLNKLSSSILSGYEKHREKKKDTKIKMIYIVISTGYKPWQQKTLEILQNANEQNFKEMVKTAFSDDKKSMGNALKFADFKYKEFLESKNKEILSPKLLYNEREFIEKNLKIITRDIKGTPVTIVTSEEGLTHPLKTVKQAAEAVHPESPLVVFDF